MSGVALAVALSLALAAPPIHAQSHTVSAADRAQAAKLKDDGNTAYAERRYADALAAYERSYKLDPEPKVAFNRSRTLAALARYPEALTALELFLKRASAAVKSQVPDLEAFAKDVRSRVTRLSVHTRVTGARVLLRSVQIGITPFDRPIVVNAGPATLEILAEGYKTYRRAVELEGGGEVTIDAELIAKRTSAVLHVGSPVAGASVAVDGRRIGVVPAEMSVGPGTHRVVVEHEGYEEASTSVVVRAGERKQLEIELDAGTPLTARWWFWTGVGVAVAGGVVTYIALTTERGADSGTLGQAGAPLLRF